MKPDPRKSPARRKPPAAAGAEQPKAPNPADAAAAAPPPEKVPPLFRRIDWLAMLLTFGIVWIAFLLTVAPELTLEDSGELCTGSFYAGIPHAPGYPVWSIYSWLWTVILPVGNVAWRVAVGEATAGAFACGLLALMVSRGSSMLMEGIEGLKGMTGKWESAICMVSGVVAGLLVGFDTIMWSESVAVNRVCVYSVPYFLMTLILCLRWSYAPHQYRYLYWALFLYGLSITTHQSLMVASIGLEILIAVRDLKMGRDIFLFNFFIYVVMWISYWTTGSFIFQNIAHGGMFVLFNLVGWGSLAISVWLAILTRGILTRWLPVMLMGLLCVLGVCFYFYEPLSSMTNPPMNWCYPRTVDGFFHAVTRGQFEQPDPTNILTDPGRYLMQLGMLAKQAIEEFTWVNVFIALVPFFFFIRMQKRERCWIIGLTAIYFCVGVLLMDLMNPTPDKASSDLIKVFFTSSHTVIAAFIGYGLALIAAFMATHYKQFRPWGILGGAIAVLLAIYDTFREISEMYKGPDTMMSLGEVLHWIGRAFAKDQYSLTVFGDLLLIALPVVFIVALVVYRERAPLLIVLGLFGAMPVHSVMTHWFGSEQRNHWFGYWYGHDMFTPPFGIYPEMTRDAILFGGTDPGRFCPTYMIFCDSFIPHKDQPPMDQKFDRRDVYIITQNALIDGPYLEYIRAQYYRSAQIDPPFFQELLRGQKERDANVKTNFIARLAGELLDRPLMRFGAKVEARRRREGVYPANEIYTPSDDDERVAYNEYMNDAARRLDHDRRLEHDIQVPGEPKQLRPGEAPTRLLQPGEDVHEENGRVTAGGQVAIMGMNGLLAKVIFDRNPDHEFFVEESFPLDWMYPYLTPYGIIMKINRKPLTEITDDICAKDHDFWSQYSERFIGNWITYNTSAADIAKFVQKVYLEKNFDGFTGDRKFVRDTDAGKYFSKLRSAIGGIYNWRMMHASSSAEQRRAVTEAEFAYKQAYAYCPFSPEAMGHYVWLLYSMGRIDDAILITSTSLKLDPHNDQAASTLKQLEDVKSGRLGPAPVANSVQLPIPVESLEQAWKASPGNLQAAFDLAGAYLQRKENDRAAAVFDQVLATPNVPIQAVAVIARAYADMPNLPKLEETLTKIAALQPDSPETWYDLAALRASLGKTDSSLAAFQRMAALNAQRLQQNPKAANLLQSARLDGRFEPLHNNPEFQRILSGP
jgi:tetratricopeptide (TPR) repeat protein